MGTEFSRGSGPKLYVGPVPGRKQEAVCVEEGTTLWPLAYLKDADDRDRLVEALKHLMAPLLAGPPMGAVVDGNGHVVGIVLATSGGEESDGRT